MHVKKESSLFRNHREAHAHVRGRGFIWIVVETGRCTELGDTIQEV